MIKNKHYNILKWVALIAIPALSVLVNTIGGIYNFEGAKQISETLNAIGLFIGALIGISTYNYNKEVNGANNEEDTK